jgi:hypothetical protein
VIIIPFLVNVGEDCPVFDGLYEFCQLSSGGSLGKFYAQILNTCERFSGCRQVEQAKG